MNIMKKFSSHFFAFESNFESEEVYLVSLFMTKYPYYQLL